MKRSVCLTFLSVCLLITSCAQEKKDYVVTIKTKLGDMVAILYNETPKHKENFIKLAKEHYFDSLLFHRVIDGFMIQGGDPGSRNARPGQVLGQGGPSYTIPAEISPKYFHEKGSLSAARLSDAQNPSKASSGSQFYIVQGTKVPEDQLKIDPEKFNQAMMQFMQNPANKPKYDSLLAFVKAQNKEGYETYLMKLKPVVEAETGIKSDKDIDPEKLKAYTTIGGTPQLDGGYTVFGKVIKGLDVIDKIAAQAKDPNDRPVKDIRMTVTVEELPVSKIEQLYGYKFPVTP
jgi:peptidyl-prolyl cis-trans isomerase B (cyclophilin B)